MKEWGKKAQIKTLWISSLSTAPGNLGALVQILHTHPSLKGAQSDSAVQSLYVSVSSDGVEDSVDVLQT